MKRSITALLALAMVILCASCVGNRDSLPVTLGVTLTDSTISEHWDSHGWMGDGTEYWKVELSPTDAAVLEQTAQTREGWHPLPVSGDGEILLYGGGYLNDKDGQPLLFPVEEGYWFFWDNQTHSPETAGVLGRGSYNYTAAVYDAKTCTLYCGELDT